MARFLTATLLLTLVVIVLGAYTRLADAGLGCPDWPGCYGHLTVPASPEAVDTEKFQRPLEKDKAWAEMIHRYVAGLLGLFILAIFLLSVIYREKVGNGVWLPSLLLLTVIFQAALGMWTVTHLLSPIIVTAHLLGGFTTLSLLWLIWLRHHKRRDKEAGHYSHKHWLRLSIFALVLVIGQIMLGGWTSTNYAAVACGVSFPTCHGSLWPEADFKQGFSLEHKDGVDYEYGILGNHARTAIHITHRAGAVVVFAVVGLLALVLLMRRKVPVYLSGAVLGLLCVQILLGILNVIWALPLAIATAHNLVAALLLLSLITLVYHFYINRLR